MANLYWPFDTSTVSEWCGGYADVRSGIHMGTDFAVGQGTPLRATTDGRIHVYLDNGYGTGIDITNDDGIVVRNWHMSEVHVNDGDWVTAGQIIGLTGGGRGTWGAGNSTGPHLHWELRDNARFNDIGWIDPRGMTVYSFDGAAPVQQNASGSVSELAAAVLRGDFGNGPSRQAALGARFDEVQAEVNRILSGGAPAAAPTPSGATPGATAVVESGDSYWAIAERTWGGDTATINDNMHKLVDLNGGKALYAGDTVLLEAPAPAPGPAPAPVVEPTPAPVVEPAPEPVVEPEKPAVKPENNEHKEKPVAELSKQDIAEINARNSTLVSNIKPADLGAIITNNMVRKVVWAIYGLAGLFIIGIMGGLTAAQWLAPEWFIFTTGAYTAVGPAFASLAMANIDTKK